MFTGLIECTGEVVSISPSAGGVAGISVRAPRIAREAAVGESVAVAGVCLTVVETGRETFRAQMMAETLRSTRLGEMKPGEAVNLERALIAGGRLDGHIVLGHVDEVGSVVRVESDGASKKIWMTASDEISWGIAAKGSVAVDGVSLTVIDSHGGNFSVGLIPTTLRNTTIGLLKEGSRANIEIDVMARYAERLARRKDEAAAPVGLTMEKLREYGWQ
ncbi:MAG: riboflavin synthase [Synergistaceae bacterium]|nr:riboflavin synthase [Synergistaceae bacterium]